MELYPADVPAAAEITRAARAIHSREDGLVMAYYPVVRANPYQSLLYSRSWQSGVAPVAIPQLADLTAVRCAPAMGVPALLHLHWTFGVIGSAPDDREAEARAAEFLDLLEQLRKHQVRIVWTLHNRLPHRCEHPAAEIRLRQRLADLADVIHIMDPEVPAEVGDLYTLPKDRLLVCPHPSYAGAYPTNHDRETVRFELGFEPDDFVVGMIGTIQPYKGVDELISAVSEPGSLPPRLRTLVAGGPGQDLRSREIVDRLQRTATISSIPTRLDDRDLARLVSALDLMALPYRASLTSGAALLSLTFGVPIVAPRTGPFRALAERGYCLTYDPDDPHGLQQALREAPDWVAGVDRQAIGSEMASLSGALVSERFFADLRNTLLGHLPGVLAH